MSLTLWGLTANYPAVSGWALELLSLVGMGVAGLATYLGLILSSWALWGKPEGADHRVLTMARDQWDFLLLHVRTTVPTV